MENVVVLVAIKVGGKITDFCKGNDGTWVVLDGGKIKRWYK